MALDIFQSIVLGRPPEPAREHALDRRLPVRVRHGRADDHLDAAGLEHLRPGAGAHAQPDRLSAVQDGPAVAELRRSRVRREGALQRLELGVDPRAVLIDEGRDVGGACAQRRHHLDAARAGH